MRVLLVTNFAPHYRAPFFERLAEAIDIEYLFTSEGTESYWQPHVGTRPVAARAQTIVGRSIGGGLTVNPRLVGELRRREYDVLIKCVNGRVELASAYAIARARHKPFVFWATMWWHPTTFSGWVYRPALQAVYAGADAIVTDGEHICRYVAGHGVDAAKIFAAPIAVDNDAYMRPIPPEQREALRDELGAAQRPVVLAVSRLAAVKGLDVLVDAASRLADLRPVVVIVGTGPLGRSLRQQAQARGVDLKIVTGVPPEVMPVYYAAADVYAMPSVTTPEVREVWGVGVNEALCQRVPVVVSDAVGAAAAGLVVHRETGLVVPERDHYALAGALRTLLEDREPAARLAAAGQERVTSITYDAMVGSFKAAAEYAMAAHSGDAAAMVALRAVRFRPQR